MVLAADDPSDGLKGQLKMMIMRRLAEIQKYSSGMKELEAERKHLKRGKQQDDRLTMEGCR